MNGAATNPDCHVLAYAGAQVKKGLDIAKKLGAENFGMNDLDLNNIRLAQYFVTIKIHILYSFLGWKRRFPLGSQH